AGPRRHPAAAALHGAARRRAAPRGDGAVSQQINLFNPVFLQQKKIFSARTMAVALLVLFAGVVAIKLYGDVRLKSLQAQADAGAAQLAAKQARLATVATEFAPRQKSAAADAELA